MEPTSVIVVPMRSAKRTAQMLLGALVVLGLGVVITLAPAIGNGSPVRDVIAFVFGGLLILLGLFIAAGWWVTLDSALVVDADGVRWRSRRSPWQLPWDQLSRASVRVGYRPGNGPLLLRSKAWRVHLELVLADEAFASDHPELTRMQRPFLGGAPDRYGIPFAQRRELIEPIDEALRAFAGDRYGGVVDDGRLPTGTGYAPKGF